MILLAGFLLAALVSAAAYRLKALDRSGALAALVLGTVIFGLGGLGWAVLLLAFFISSSALSKAFKRRKSRFEEKFSKGSQRDVFQVLANGGVAGVCVLLHLFFPGQSWPWLAFAGSLAAANADTWATELGVLSSSQPRLITTYQPVERGASGGVTSAGTLAALCGSLLVALLAVLFWPGRVASPALPGWQWPNDALGAGIAPLPFEQAIPALIWITFSGLLGSLFDSILGATVQAIYYCPACQKETERHPLHSCGTPTTLVRGLPWMDNDLVNAGCTALGAIIAGLAALILF